MSELKAVESRTVEQVHKEYSTICANIGHISYQVFTLKKDLEILHQQARDLSIEASTLKAAEVKTNE